MPAYARAQSWNFDARAIGLGGVGSTRNLALKMIDEQRPHTSIVLPFGLIQVFSDVSTFNPSSKNFGPVRAVELAANPIHYVVGRREGNSAEALFVSDIRNATLNRDLSTYRGFAPANDLLIEEMAAPNFGGTITIRRDARGGFQGIYLGVGPYFSMRTAGTIDSGLTGVWASGVNLPNARLPISSVSEGQMALAITGGYRGRFAWAQGIGSGSDRDGLYVAVNYDYLRGFRYEQIEMNIQFDTDSAGLLTPEPSTTPLVIKQREGGTGRGFAFDAGIGAIINRWEFGVGANGIANRIDWSGLTETSYSLATVTSGNSDFLQTPAVPLANRRVDLPVDYRANVTYTADLWSASAEVGHGFGGGSLHGGVERRFNRVELRAGALYTSSRWNPTGGIGFNVTPRVSLDIAAFGTTANIERERQMAIAASVRVASRIYSDR